MFKEQDFGIVAQRYSFYNLLFITFCWILGSIAFGGGTGDIEDCEFFIIMYLQVKGIVSFIRGISGILYGLIKKVKVKLTSIIWFVYSIILFTVLIVKSSVIGETKYPYVTGFSGVNTSIFILVADSMLFAIYSLTLSIVAFKKMEDSLALALSANIALFIFFVVMILTGSIARFV